MKRFMIQVPSSRASEIHPSAVIGGLMGDLGFGTSDQLQWSHANQLAQEDTMLTDRTLYPRYQTMSSAKAHF